MALVTQFCRTYQARQLSNKKIIVNAFSLYQKIIQNPLNVNHQKVGHSCQRAPNRNLEGKLTFEAPLLLVSRRS